MLKGEQTDSERKFDQIFHYGENSGEDNYLCENLGKERRRG